MDSRNGQPYGGNYQQQRYPPANNGPPPFVPPTGQHGGPAGYGGGPPPQAYGHAPQYPQQQQQQQQQPYPNQPPLGLQQHPQHAQSMQRQPSNSYPAQQPVAAGPSGASSSSSAPAGWGDRMQPGLMATPPPPAPQATGVVAGQPVVSAAVQFPGVSSKEGGDTSKLLFCVVCASNQVRHLSVPIIFTRCTLTAVLARPNRAEPIDASPSYAPRCWP